LKLKFALWADIVTTKISLGISPFQLLYGVEAIFPTKIDFPMEKFLQDYQGEPDDMVKEDTTAGRSAVDQGAVA
jgi:hypothetical protein